MTTQRAIRQTLRRLPRRRDAFLVPRAVDGDRGCFVIDATWGKLNPIELRPGVRTVGELEVIAHIEQGLPVVDTRLPHFFAAGTIPTAGNIPHMETTERMREYDQAVETVLFCNGPQCAATPDAVRALLTAGHAPEGLVYYRGGIHDWMTLGLPVVPGAVS